MTKALIFDQDSGLPAANPVILFPNDWSANYFAQTNSKVPLSSLPIGGTNK